MKRCTGISCSLAILFVLLARPAAAQDGFYDDFSDGSTTDGVPVAWEPWRSSVLDASSGDAVISGNVRLSGNSYSGMSLVDRTYGDVSLRTRARLDEGEWIAVSIRKGEGTLVEEDYVAGVRRGGGIQLGRLHPSGGFLGEEIPTDLRPASEDIILQIDAIGDTISFWAWRPGDSMPVEPLSVFQDDLIEGGGVSVNFGSTLNENVSGAFRYIWVDTKSIPEPSSFTTAILGLLGILGCARGRTAAL